MKCPTCKADDSRVIDSRSVLGGVRRRRECLACCARFTTYERVETVAVQVVKRDGRREPFSPLKLLGGIQRACEKRPLATGAVADVAAQVERDVLAAATPEVSTAVIGDLVMTHLRDLDQIAYVRFASVYRQFADLGSLRAVIAELDAAEAAQRQPVGAAIGPQFIPAQGAG